MDQVLYLLQCIRVCQLFDTSVTMTIVQMGSSNLKEIKRLAQSHPGIKWQNQYSKVDQTGFGQRPLGHDAQL